MTVKACSHITGGGFYENVPRMLKEGTHAVIRKDSYEVPVIFDMLAKEGDIEEHMMYNTFNMGIGMVIAVDEQDVEAALSAVKAAGDKGFVIGTIQAGEKRSHIMLRVAVLVSGGGTNLQAILDAVKVGTIDNTEVVGVISKQ